MKVRRIVAIGSSLTVRFSSDRTLTVIAAFPETPHPRKKRIAATAAPVVSMALNRPARNQGRDWGRRIEALMVECKINSTAKMTRLLREVGKAGKVSEAGATGNVR